MSFANYNYYKNYYEIFNRPELKNTDIVDISSYVSCKYFDLNEKYRDYNKREKIPDNYDFEKSQCSYFNDNDIVADLKDLDAVENVYYCYYPPISYDINDVSADAIFMSDDTYKLFYDYPLESGSTFADVKQTSKYPNAIVSGEVFKDVCIGDDITLTATCYPANELNNKIYDKIAKHDYETKEYKVHVIGKASFPYEKLNTIPSAQIQLSIALNTKRMSMVYLRDDEFTLNYFSQACVKAYPSSTIVKYKDDVTEAEMEEFRSYCDKVTKEHFNNVYKNLDLPQTLTRINVNGEHLNFEPYNHPLKKAYKYQINKLNLNMKNKILPVMFFLAIIGIISAVFVSILFYRKKQKEIEIYRICGCSRSKAYGLFLSVTAEIIIFIGVIITAYMLVYSSLKDVINDGKNGSIASIPFNAAFVSFESNCYIYVWTYLLLVFVAAAIVLYFLIRKENSFIATLFGKLDFKRKNKQLEQEIMRQKENSTEEYYSLLESQNEKTKILIHDINRHLNAIKNMSEDKNTDIPNYIKNITEDFGIDNPIDYCNNAQLNVIVNRYKKLCDEHGISMNIDIRRTNVSFMENPDITALFDNLLENSYEAAINTKSAFIDLTVAVKREHYLAISVANSTRSIIPVINNDLQSTKAGAHHGVGLKSIKRVVKKYGGEMFMDFSKNDMIFTTNIVFDIKS